MSGGRQQRGSCLLGLVTLVLGTSLGCGPADLLDGTWRQPVESAEEGNESFELVLGQYGEGVAGLVRQYHRLTTPEGGLYGTPHYCRPLEHGRFLADRLTFRFQDPDGQAWDFVLAWQEAEERLVGQRLPADGGEGEGSERALTFARVSGELDRECQWLRELRLPVVYNDELDPARDQPRTLRAAVLLLGTADGASCQVVGARSGPLEHKAQTLVIDQKPTSCLVLQRPEALTLGFGVFVLFEDRDGNGYWDRDPLPGGVAEPLVGLARETALVYLDGELSGEDLAADHPLRGFTSQGYTLVQLLELAADGTVRAWRALGPAAAATSVIALQPVDAAPAPRLRVP